MKGQSRLKIGAYIYIEDIFAENNAVIFKYSLTDRWNALSQKKQNKYQQLMQKDLTYRTCSLQTVRISQEKGLVEVHHYYDKYPMHILFTLNANKQLCVMSGF
ncbi:hypothetical protein VQ643_15840 [Pseudomonas sp. F1_0610]|uniref:hypothetical protein n=1 Tax=Pseudomonas sp. F1_0610 TaxID=3114284 RepID=UPI0039C0BDB7